MRIDVRYMTRLRLLITLGSVVFSLVAIAEANGARAPTRDEREAITRALPAFIRNAPAECLWLHIRVSRNPRFALVGRLYLNFQIPRCARLAGDGVFILRKARTWKIVYVGSDPPSCSLRIPRDLTPCLPKR